MSKQANNSVEFRYADGVSLDQIKGPKRTLSKAERNSLVKRSKSRTSKNQAILTKCAPSIPPTSGMDELRPVFEAETNGAGLYTMIQYRDWSNEYRIRTRVETSLRKPPIADGPRTSNMLTYRGALKITESCYYMAKLFGGYKTFVTGTFKPETRQKIKLGETTIQREVSRTLNSMQKMYQRGWLDQNGNHIEGSTKPLSYCWVVEIPLNDDGEENPHVHMMLDWRVPHSQFDYWSARIETIWGNGYFHLEKIKDPLCAGAYMAKAAGYMTKSASQPDQGIVRGNRYGISKSARAPGWYTVSESELGVMGKLISEMNEMYMAKHGGLHLQKIQLKKSLESCPKHYKVKRQKVGRKLQEVRQRIEKIPIVTSKYQLIFKTAKAFFWYLGWATGAGWKANKRPESRWIEQFKSRLSNRRQYRRLCQLRWSDKEWNEAKHAYSDYEQYDKVDTSMQDYFEYERETNNLL